MLIRFRLPRRKRHSRRRTRKSRSQGMSSQFLAGPVISGKDGTKLCGDSRLVSARTRPPCPQDPHRLRSHSSRGAGLWSTEPRGVYLQSTKEGLMGPGVAEEAAAPGGYPTDISLKWPAPENEGSFHTVQIWGQLAVNHFIVSKRLSTLAMLGIVRAGHYIAI